VVIEDEVDESIEETVKENSCRGWNWSRDSVHKLIIGGGIG